MKRKTDIMPVLAFIVSTILAGSNAIAVGFSNQELPPFFGAGIRFTGAVVILSLAVIIMKLPLPKGRSLAGTLLYGVLQFGASYALFYWSLIEVPPGLFQVILSLAPLFTFFFAIAHGQEKFQWRILVGAVLAVIGIAIIFNNQIRADVSPLRLLAIVAAAACVAEASVIIKSFPESHPVTSNMLGMGVGAVMLFAASLLFGESPAVPEMASTYLAVGYLILFGSVSAFVLILFVLSRWKASVASYQLVLMPIVTIILSAWITGERITAAFLVGGGFVLLGVLIGTVLPDQILQNILTRNK